MPPLIMSDVVGSIISVSDRFSGGFGHLPVNVSPAWTIKKLGAGTSEHLKPKMLRAFASRIGLGAGN